MYIKWKQLITKKFLHDNLIKTCKKWDQRKINNIIKDAKKIAVVPDLEDRTEKMQASESYISVKNDKEDFPDKISCLLIDPPKLEIGKINKHVLDKVNQKLISVTKVNQCKNSH